MSSYDVDSHDVRLLDFDAAALARSLLPLVDEELEPVAHEVAASARASTLFKDSKKNKNKLRRSISVRKSKYEFGGWLVRARAPHAHLVEFGHAVVNHDGRVVGHVAARPFLRAARDSVLRRVLARWGR